MGLSESVLLWIFRGLDFQRLWGVTVATAGQERRRNAVSDQRVGSPTDGYGRVTAQRRRSVRQANVCSYVAADGVVQRTTLGGGT